MKKIIAMMLSLSMVMATGNTAFAAENQEADISASKTITVEGKYIDHLKADTVISVDVKWDAMNFTYAASAEGVWNPEKHQFTQVEENKGWTKDTATIEVSNHSNTAITAGLNFAQETTLEGTINGTFTESSGTANDNTLELESAVGTSVQTPPSASAEFGVSGDAITQTQKIGTVTVAINKKGESVQPTVSSIAMTKGPDGDKLYRYSYEEEHDPDWSKLDITVTYSDGSTSSITGTTDGVSITPSANSQSIEEAVAVVKDSSGNTQCTYDVIYQGKTTTVRITVWIQLPGMLPAPSVCIDI